MILLSEVLPSPIIKENKKKIKKNGKRIIRNLIIKYYIVSYGLNDFCKKFLIPFAALEMNA